MLPDGSPRRLVLSPVLDFEILDSLNRPFAWSDAVHCHFAIHSSHSSPPTGENSVLIIIRLVRLTADD